MKHNLRNLFVALVAAFILLPGYVSAQATSIDTQAQSSVNGTIFSYLKENVGTNSSSTCYNGTKSNSSYACLVQALETTGLDKALAGAGSFTLFAPSDAAFKQLAQTMTQEQFDALFKDAAKLTAILSYHVLPEKQTLASLLDSADASGNYTTKTLEGSELFLAFADNGAANTTIALATEETLSGSNVANVTTATILANNGTIIPIDRVLTPPTS
jgi:uncharacterized surface protein with fasciclin (FAS1) repeats